MRRVNEGTPNILTQSRLDKQWWAESLERTVQDLWSGGTTPYERRFEKQFGGPIIPLGAKDEYPPTQRKVRRGSISSASRHSRPLDGLCCTCGLKRERKPSRGRMTGQLRIRSIFKQVVKTKELLVPQRFRKVGRKSFLKFEHPTEFDKRSKEEEKSAVIFKEKRMHQILQFTNIEQNELEFKHAF